MSTAHAPSVPRLSLAHTRLSLLEIMREPIAVIGTTVFPALSFLFFVVPQRAIAENPVMATGAAAQLAVVGVMAVCLFTFGAGVAEDRSRPFDTYLRTLPAGPLPQLLGRIVSGAVLSALGLIPIIALAAAFTEAQLPTGRLLLTVLALLLGGVPLLTIGFAVGYTLRQKSAIAVAQLLFFGLAFAGGLFVPPEVFPGWLDAFSLGLPSRASRDLVVWAVGSGELTAITALVLAGWTLIGLLVTVWAFRRDEGRRFR